MRQPIKFNKTANRMLVLCLSHLSHLSQRRLPYQKQQPNWPVSCLSDLSEWSAQRISSKKTTKLVGFVFVSPVSLVSMSQGNFSGSEKKRPVSMVEKEGKEWLVSRLSHLSRCCLDCLNSRFHAARRPNWPVSCLSQLHQLSQHKVSCSKTIKMDVLWSQSMPIVSIAGFMQKKIKKNRAKQF